MSVWVLDVFFDVARPGKLCEEFLFFFLFSFFFFLLF